MKKTSRYILSAIVILLILGLVGYYLYDVLVLKTEFSKNVFRLLAAVFLLLGTLVRLQNPGSRRSLTFYEKAYEKELEGAFLNEPFLRKKLLCACRLYDEGNCRKAIKYLGQLLKDAEYKEDVCPVLLFMALCYTDAGLPEEAIKVYDEILHIDLYNPQVHNNLGLLYAKVGDYEKAFEHYDRALQHKPDHYYAYINRANLYFRKKEYDKAVEDAEQALEIKNNCKEAASLLTVIYALWGDKENQKKYYHTAITSGYRPEDLDANIRYFLSEEAAFAEDEEDLDEEAETLENDEE